MHNDIFWLTLDMAARALIGISMPMKKWPPSSSNELILFLSHMKILQKEQDPGDPVMPGMGKIMLTKVH